MLRRDPEVSVALVGFFFFIPRDEQRAITSPPINKWINQKGVNHGRNLAVCRPLPYSGAKCGVICRCRRLIWAPFNAQQVSFYTWPGVHPAGQLPTEWPLDFVFFLLFYTYIFINVFFGYYSSPLLQRQTPLFFTFSTPPSSSSSSHPISTIKLVPNCMPSPCAHHFLVFSLPSKPNVLFLPAYLPYFLSLLLHSPSLLSLFHHPTRKLFLMKTAHHQYLTVLFTRRKKKRMELKPSIHLRKEAIFDLLARQWRMRGINRGE